jgi:hypothetical protein
MKMNEVRQHIYIISAKEFIEKLGLFDGELDEVRLAKGLEDIRIVINERHPFKK